MCEVGDMECITDYAISAGNDVEMGGGSYNYQKIPEMVQSGRLDMSLVDQAVSRVLTTKFAMGLFENPYTGLPTNQTNATIHTVADVALARKLDAESIVLLENHNDTLPLSRNQKIAVIGPMASGIINVSNLLKFHHSLSFLAVRGDFRNPQWPFGTYSEARCESQLGGGWLTVSVSYSMVITSFTSPTSSVSLRSKASKQLWAPMEV